MKLDLIKAAAAIIGLISYSIPLILYDGVTEYEYTISDIIYAVGSTLGIGVYLFVDSLPLKKITQYITISAGFYYIGLSITFLANNMMDIVFRTYWFVVFNTVITLLLCLYLLFYHRTHLRH